MKEKQNRQLWTDMETGMGRPNGDRVKGYAEGVTSWKDR